MLFVSEFLFLLSVLAFIHKTTLALAEFVSNNTFARRD
jgi:hypothetical protein